MCKVASCLTLGQAGQPHILVSGVCLFTAATALSKTNMLFKIPESTGALGNGVPSLVGEAQVEAGLFW